MNWLMGGDNKSKFFHRPVKVLDTQIKSPSFKIPMGRKLLKEVLLKESSLITFLTD